MILQGSLNSESDFLLTIGDQDNFKSYLLKENTFAFSDSNTINIKIDYNDFIVPNVIDLQMPENRTWLMADISYTNESDNTIKMYQWSNSRENIKAKNLKLFFDPNHQIITTKFNVATNDGSPGYEFNIFMDDIPNILIKENVSVSIDDAQFDNFALNISGEYDYGISSYSYRIPDELLSSTYRIYHSNQDLNFNFTIPEFPEDLLKEESLISEIIGTKPIGLSTSIIKFNGDHKPSFNTTKLNRNCFEFYMAKNYHFFN